MIYTLVKSIESSMNPSATYITRVTTTKRTGDVFNLYNSIGPATMAMSDRARPLLF